jgi:subtilisin family serine protease
VETLKRGGGLEYKKGTSMSAPQVVGVCAILLSEKPEYKPNQLREIIKRSAEDIEEAGFDQNSGYGLLRADRALNQAWNLGNCQVN